MLFCEVDGPYRVQQGKPWYRRHWQAEWDGCRWATRGYTRRGVLMGAWVRQRWGWRMDAVYVRVRRAVRRLHDPWHRDFYGVLGAPRDAIRKDSM